MTGYLYTPGSAGDWLVVAATGRLLVARIDGDAARAERCLAVLDAGTSVSNLVDILSSQGLESTGPFALLFWVDGEMGDKGLGVIVRGTPEVTVHGADGDQRVVAGGFMTWSEQLVDGATGFRVETGSASDGAASDLASALLDLPFTGGAVWATSVATDAAASALSGARGAEATAQAVAQLSEVDDAIDGATVIVPTRARRREQSAANAEPEASSATTGESVEQLAPAPAESDAAGPAATSDAATPAHPSSASTLATPATPPTPAATPVEETRVFHTTTARHDGEASDDSSVGAAANSAGAASDAESYDYLFGATIFRPVGQAAVAEEDDEDGEGTGAPAAASEAPSSTATAATPTVATGDHDGSTVFSTDIRQAREESRARAGGHGDGSAEPAASASAPADQTDAHRSGGYVLVLPDGRSQELNAPVIIGRAPSVSNVPASVLPHLITLSADDISRNHARIAVEGGTVVVTDLLSSNGTQVIQPGKPPLSLRGGEPTPVIVGTVVDLGSGITLTIAEA